MELPSTILCRCDRRTRTENVIRPDSRGGWGTGYSGGDERATPIAVPKCSQARVSAGPARGFRVPLIRGLESVAASGGPRVPVVQPADTGNGDHLAALGWLDCTGNRRIPIERQVGSGVVIAREVRGQYPNQMSFVKHDHVIQTLATDRANQSLDVGALPWRYAMTTSSMPRCFMRSRKSWP